MLASNGKRISRDNVTCFGANKCPWSRGPQSIIRVVDVWDINIKAEACNLHCGMICGHLLHDVDKLNQEQKKHGLDVGLKSLTSVMEKVNRNPTYNMACVNYWLDP